MNLLAHTTWSFDVQGAVNGRAQLLFQPQQTPEQRCKSVVPCMGKGHGAQYGMAWKRMGWHPLALYGMPRRLGGVRISSNRQIYSSLCSMAVDLHSKGPKGGDFKPLDDGQALSA